MFWIPLLLNFVILSTDSYEGTQEIDAKVGCEGTQEILVSVRTLALLTTLHSC
jgi:hypothetical protein